MIEDDDEDVLPKLSPMQERFLDLIQDRIESGQPAPTYTELSAHFRCARYMAQIVIAALVKKGRIRIEARKWRGIKLVEP